MSQRDVIKAPFFEIGAKSYLYGDDILKLAKIADTASKKYDIDIIYTTPYADIRRVVEETDRIFVFAPHMDPIPLGRGLANILPESVKAAGAQGVMLNHCEKPISLSVLYQTIKRAKALSLMTIVCADSIAEAGAVACLNPDIVVPEPSELIGTGQISDMSYVQASIQAVKSHNSRIMVLQGAGISSGDDVYRIIRAGAEATGAASGIVKASNWEAMVNEMIYAVRTAWDEMHPEGL